MLSMLKTKSFSFKKEVIVDGGNDYNKNKSKKKRATIFIDSQNIQIKWYYKIYNI